MRTLSLLALAVALTACASVPQRVASPPDPAVLRSQLQQMDRYGFEGKLAAAVGTEGFNADLSWQQRGTRSTLALRAPLGLGSARIVNDADNVSFVSSRGDRLAGADAIAELERRMGFAPPLAALRFWVLGVADPARPAVESPDADGRLASLEQDGWRVVYSEYRGSAGVARAAALPRRLTLTRDPIRLRLVVNRWHLTLP